MSASTVLAALAWALAHSLWQAAALALALEATLAALPSGLGWGARRHRAAAAALALCVLLPPTTALWLLVSPPAAAAAAGLAAGSAQAASAGPAQAGATLGGAATLLGAALPWLRALWGAAAAMALLRLLVGVRQLRTFVASSTVAPAEVSARCDALAARLGLRRRPRVLLSSGTGSPAAVGGRRPAILLPARTLAALRDDELEGVLLHELAHLARRDDVLAFLQALAQALLVFSPAAHVIARRLREEREHRADDLVACISGRARYAHLLARLDELRAPGPLHAGALAAAGTPLVRRIRRIATPAPGRPVAALGGATILALVLVGGGRLLAASAAALPRGMRMVVHAVDDAGPFTVSLLDGRVVGATLDGREVPAPRLRLAGDSLRFLDARGRAALSVRLLPGGGLSWQSRTPRR